MLRYGNTRELMLGVEVVLADGSVCDGLRGLRKDNTGYDLKQLFIGAEGTLGIVTAAVLKLFPAPRTRVTALAAVAVGRRRDRAARAAQATLVDRLVGFELMSAFSLALSRKHHAGRARSAARPSVVRARAGRRQRGRCAARGAARGRARATRSKPGIAADAALAQSGDQAERLWALRENISEAQRREGPNIKHDISLPVSAIPRVPARMPARRSRAAFPGARLVIFGHLGDGNLHYNLVGARRASRARSFMDNAARANRIVHDLVAAHGGSFSAEHGVGPAEARGPRPLQEPGRARR